MKKKILMLFLAFGMLFCGTTYVFADCEDPDCEESGTCPPQPPDDSMSSTLGE